MYKFAKQLVKNIPYIRSLRKKIVSLETELEKWKTWKEPGHFYSPITSITEVRKDENRIFKDSCNSLKGIELYESAQLEKLEHFANYYTEIPFERKKNNRYRYYYENPYYSYADGIVLYCMLRHLKPKKIIEVGSGYSSALMLDTNERFFSNQIELTFIDPFPERLTGLLTTKDLKTTKILANRVQDVPISTFNQLQSGDILFIDSSHVSKTGSDVNFLLFDILPNLKSGVHIHFHDIFYPFEYPKDWVYEGLSWNEAYILRAFLQYNDNFRISFFTSFLLKYHKQKMIKRLPLITESEKTDISLYDDAPAANLWLTKVK